ncbi:DUF4845 domain-containing protein [Azoarcus sp. L1K30]|uniref:DUF4845 domain-containing protein n=1 Tax=Azoarcus sp. L1K30 TaxID=2820277 RepID=UPI001B81D351|nr:DUF4845 domain-containing protein [Azoarcus sp. L1K30]MBR0565705.1 DUF4845 domain-containing protein [Azoarcus sp. L1K30]
MTQFRQRGLSLISILIVGAFMAFVLLIGFRTVPAINEYLTIKRVVKIVADEGDNGSSISEMRRSFDRRGQIDDVSSITGADLEIRKVAGKVVVETSYARKVPVAGNVSLLFDFQASSAEN